MSIIDTVNINNQIQNKKENKIMMEIRTANFTAKDMFNAATAMPLKSAVGSIIKVVGIWVTERPDLNGEVQVVANLKADDGTIYGTISDTVIRSVVALPEMLEESGEIAIKPEFRQGTKGREYLVISLA